jgi:mannose-6-phosphate isomerase-like protein (cupin superfamily)
MRKRTVDHSESSGLTADAPKIEKVDIAEKFDLVADYWRPKIVGQLNGQEVKLVKFKGAFIWHHHDDEDEMFLGVRGQFRIQLTERDILVKAGEFIIIPRGVEHRPIADEEVQVLLFEPAGTRNTGNIECGTYTDREKGTI